MIKWYLQIRYRHQYFAPPDFSSLLLVHHKIILVCVSKQNIFDVNFFQFWITHLSLILSWWLRKQCQPKMTDKYPNCLKLYNHNGITFKDFSMSQEPTFSEGQCKQLKQPWIENRIITSKWTTRGTLHRLADLCVQYGRNPPIEWVSNVCSGNENVDVRGDPITPRPQPIKTSACIKLKLYSLPHFICHYLLNSFKIEFVSRCHDYQSWLSRQWDTAREGLLTGFDCSSFSSSLITDVRLFCSVVLYCQ